MRSRRLAFTLIVGLLGGSFATLHAQVTTATVYGTVRDATAAALPGATVSIRHQGTGFTRDSATSTGVALLLGYQFL